MDDFWTVVGVSVGAGVLGNYTTHGLNAGGRWACLRLRSSSAKQRLRIRLALRPLARDQVLRETKAYEVTWQMLNAVMSLVSTVGFALGALASAAANPKSLQSVGLLMAYAISLFLVVRFVGLARDAETAYRLAVKLLVRRRRASRKIP